MNENNLTVAENADLLVSPINPEKNLKNIKIGIWILTAASVLTILVPWVASKILNGQSNQGDALLLPALLASGLGQFGVLVAIGNIVLGLLIVIKQKLGLVLNILAFVTIVASILYIVFGPWGIVPFLKFKQLVSNSSIKTNYANSLKTTPNPPQIITVNEAISELKSCKITNAYFGSYFTGTSGPKNGGYDTSTSTTGIVTISNNSHNYSVVDLYVSKSLESPVIEATMAAQQTCTNLKTHDSFEKSAKTGNIWKSTD